MKYVNEELKKIEAAISEDSIKVENGLINIWMYDLYEYSPLIKEILVKKENTSVYSEKESLIKDLKKVFFSKRKKFKKILSNFKKAENKMLNMDLFMSDESIKNSLISIFTYDKSLSAADNINKYFIAKLKSKIHELSEEIYILDNYPYVYINSQDRYIGSNFRLKYDRDIIVYKDLHIQATQTHSYSIFSNINSKEQTKQALLNITAFFHGQPYFTYTENYNFNKKLNDLYYHFDLLDLLRLRQKDFFDSKMEQPISIESPIFKNTNNYNLVILPSSRHEGIFDLYHSSLKQFEPLPRCIFLYRVFEYGAAQHYKKIFKPKTYETEDALNYYVDKIMKYDFLPLFYLDMGTYLDPDTNKVVKKRKPQFINLMTKLKKEAKDIFYEWSNDQFLSKKNGAGDIIYNTGRNLVAHGGNGDYNMKYDYSKNYKHINNVNIILELVARYLIEVLNPEMNNIVERRKLPYIKYNNYEKIFGLDIDD